MVQTVIRLNDQQSAPWSGGQTTTLVQFPLQTDYAFRISVATIEQKITTFSNFAGYLRRHMLLEGASKLVFGEETVEMRGQFPQHHFDGSVACTCELYSDSARAFNIAYKPELDVEVTAPFVAPNVLLKANDGLKPVYEIFYCIKYSGIIFTTAPLQIRENEVLVILRLPGDPALNIQINDGLEFIRVRITF